jgi:hypothetical protein
MVQGSIGAAHALGLQLTGLTRFQRVSTSAAIPRRLPDSMDECENDFRDQTQGQGRGPASMSHLALQPDRTSHRHITADDAFAEIRDVP